MNTLERAYPQVVKLILTVLCLLTPGHVYASLSHRATLLFPDRAEHAAQQDTNARHGDHRLTSNPQHTWRVGARDVGKAAAVRRWVGPSPDGEGKLAWAAAHSAYGAVIETQGPDDVEVDGSFVQSDGPRVESPFRLLGQVNDEDAELCWTRFRCFDADSGTWISTDPLEINGGLALYSLDGSPSDVVDPLGLSTSGGNPHVDAVVMASNGSIKRAVEESNKAGLTQEEAVDAISRVTKASGRDVGTVATMDDGSKVLTGVRVGPGPVVHVAPDGQASMGIGTLGVGKDPTSGMPGLTVSDVTLKCNRRSKT